MLLAFLKHKQVDVLTSKTKMHCKLISAIILQAIMSLENHVTKNSSHTGSKVRIQFQAHFTFKLLCHSMYVAQLFKSDTMLFCAKILI